MEEEHFYCPNRRKGSWNGGSYRKFVGLGTPGTIILCKGARWVGYTVGERREVESRK